MLGVGLVLAGSVAHALWNLLVKRSGVAGPEFVWLYSVLVTPALLGLLLLSTATDGGLGQHAEAGVVSAALHTAYALVLQRSYATGELGVVYPVARAGAPVLVALGAGALLHQGGGPALAPGLAVLAVGIGLLLGRGPEGVRAGLRAVAAGGLVAVATAAYTLWDGYAVSRLHVDVVAYLAVGSAAQLLVLSLVVLPARERLGAVARAHWRAAVPVAVLVPLSYGLVLAALRLLDVQVVAALRSTSIVAAAALGWWLLGEPRDARRVTGVVLISVGVAVVALGGAA